MMVLPAVPSSQDGEKPRDRHLCRRRRRCSSARRRAQVRDPDSAQVASGAVHITEPLDACHVGGEEVDAVPVEVAAGAVVVLRGSRVGVPGEDLSVA